VSNAYTVVRQFEEAMAEYAGSKYAVAVESCSAAIFLCCKYVDVSKIGEILIPSITYPSVPASIVNAGGRVRFVDHDWQGHGFYSLHPTDIIDSAKYLARGMYQRFSGEPLVCLSFHAKKTLPIGRGGMVLTNSSAVAAWFRCARFDGRHECALDKDTLAMAGWNMYLSIEAAARGLELMQWIKDENLLPPDPYTDLSKYSFYTEANR
jgi:dTDP-4-amino-4,6-dideoxygalactose transaminase